MPHEPKFYVVVLLLLELVAAGIVIVSSQSKTMGWTMLVVGGLGLLGVFLFWPESQTGSAPSIFVQQNSEGPNSPNISGSGNTVNINPTPSGTLADPDTIFKERPDPLGATLTLGCMHIWIDGLLLTSMQQGQTVPIIRILGHDKGQYGVPLELFMKDKTLYANATIYSPRTGTGFILRGNDYTVTNPDWDQNHNDGAIEVVNEVETPVFQMIRESRDSIRINALFGLFDVALAYTPKAFGRITSNGQFVHGDYDPPQDFLLPMFEHPGRRYPEQLTKYPDPSEQCPSDSKGYVRGTGDTFEFGP